MHPITTAIETIDAALKDAAASDPVFLTTAQKREALIRLMRQESQLAELRLRVEAAASDVADQAAAHDIGAVLVAQALDDPKRARSDLALAQALERHEPVRTGLAEGRFTLAHARIITKTLDDLPDQIPAEVIEKAEAQLCELATQFGPADLRKLATRILALVAPELAEDADAKAIARLEEQAAAKATLTISDHGDGMARIHALVPTAVGERLRTMIEAYTQPRIAALEADGRIRPRNRIMAEAFAHLLECIDCDKVPAHGGDATTIIVTLPLDQLKKDLGVAQLGDTMISAAEARRLACTSAIIPAVLGGGSEPLDLGRARRLFSPAQRKALRMRDDRCRADGCSVPATWCDAHHHNPWSKGGTTDLNNAVLLCGHHHRRAHDPAYDTARLPNGDYRYHRRR